MSNLPISSKYVSSPDKPVDARERDAIVARVNGAFEEGRLDDFDYRALLDQTFAAQTLGDLRPVVEKLPAQATYATPGNIAPARVEPGQLSEAKAPSGKLVVYGALGGALALALLVVLLIVLL